MSSDALKIQSNLPAIASQNSFPFFEDKISNEPEYVSPTEFDFYVSSERWYKDALSESLFDKGVNQKLFALKEFMSKVEASQRVPSRIEFDSEVSSFVYGARRKIYFRDFYSTSEESGSFSYRRTKIVFSHTLVTKFSVALFAVFIVLFIVGFALSASSTFWREPVLSQAGVLVSGLGCVIGILVRDRVRSELG